MRWALLAAEEVIGERGLGIVLRIGRISTQHGIKEQGAAFSVATLIATKALLAPARIRITMENI